MTYRPTVRYDDVYCDYIDKLHEVTTLSRAQIIRLALFSAPFSPLFNTQINKFSKRERETSSPSALLWEVSDHGLWMDRNFKKEEEKGSDVVVNTKKTPTVERPAREVYNGTRIKQVGGISFKLG